ncbi:MAG: zinc ribbon domain-containing protein [Actinomycetota bacterium]
MELTRDSVRTLLDLQRVDSSIDALLARRSALPEQVELDRLTAEIEKVRQQTAKLELDFTVVARESTKLETEVSNLEQKLAHESERLYSGSVSSPKELTSIQAEIDALRRRKSHVEDQLLEVMDKRESSEKTLGESKAELASLESQVSAAIVARDDSSTHIESDLLDLRAERERIVPMVPDEALEIYDDIRPKRQGVAVAALEGGVCRGCMVSLSPFALDAIRRSDEPLVRCENCRRLLVIT